MDFHTKWKRYGGLLWFVVPAMVFALVFCYLPMSGLLMAFKGKIDLTEYNNPIASIIMAPGGKYFGFEQFMRLFSSETDFLMIFANTLSISVLKIVIVFPMPIILAILIVEVKNVKFSKTVQSLMYLPHFLSWAIVSTMFIGFLRVDDGALNVMLKALSIGQIDLAKANQFQAIMVGTTAWKDVGWSAVAYIAAILAIDQEQFEAARIDGASKFKQVIHITLPCISGTIAVLLILRIGYLMDAGFEQINAMLVESARSKGEVIGTYIYKTSIKNGGELAFTTAAGLFNSVISLVLIVGGNLFVKKFFNRGIF